MMQGIIPPVNTTLQSTPHLRGATPRDGNKRIFPQNFNPRPTCVGRQQQRYLLCHEKRTSIHAPPAWGDRPLHRQFRGQGTTIHAPPAWGDAVWWVGDDSVYDFNPRPTCVGRQFAETKSPVVLRLQSTPHLRGATVSLPASMLSNIRLQSTPHMRGATIGLSKSVSARADFNPRPTCVGRLDDFTDVGHGAFTSIHAPHAWGDLIKAESRIKALETSIHAPHAWGDSCLS